MVVGFFHDGPIYRDCDGVYHNGVLNDDIIERYFYLADQFVGVTRIYPLAGKDETTCIRHENVKFVAVPNLNTVKGQLFLKKECNKIVEEQVKQCDYVIARVPSYVASTAIRYARKYNKPFLTEVVGCPWDSLWNHSWKGKILAPRSYRGMRKLMHDVPYAIYVTNEFLQNRYPTTGRHIGCSDVDLPSVDVSILEERLKQIDRKQDKELVIGTLANVNLHYKGHDFVIKALGELKKKGFNNFEYQLVGSGDASKLKALCKKHNVEKEVVFIGPKPHSEVFTWLDTIDIYAQPSRTEGMPRALIEAESRGLIAFGSDAGGIPELLDNKFVFKLKGNPVKEIQELLLGIDIETMKAQAKENFARACKFERNHLKMLRESFYDEIIQERHND